MAFMQISVKKKYEMIIAVIKNDMYKKLFTVLESEYFGAAIFIPVGPDQVLLKGQCHEIFDFRFSS